MQDDSPFIGPPSVRVLPTEGYEVVGTPSGSDGETIFADVLPGTYTIEASAPGFLAVRKLIQIETGSRLQTVLLIMKPRPSPANAPPPSLSIVVPEATANPSPKPAIPPNIESVVPATAPATAPSSSRTSWAPPDIDKIVPTVQAGVACPLPQVVSGVGQRMKELVDNLQKFDAMESVEHFNVDAAGSRGKPDARTFDYVVAITLTKTGVFLLEEYRNGSADPSLFPSQIGTMGLSAMALIFHPTIVSDFDLTCEGLGQQDGHPAWQIHFAQRADRPSRLRQYQIGQRYFPMASKGRVWIDAATNQVRRLESDLLKPIAEIELTRDYMAIDYGPVQFQTRKLELWLPLDADVYWERRRHRFYRRHTFSNFKIFGVESAQQIQAPRESYCFKNTIDHDIAGILTVSSVSGISVKSVSIQFTIPSGGSVCKFVGPGKDVNMPSDEVGSATFTHNGIAGSIIAEANVVNASTLDIIP